MPIDSNEHAVDLSTLVESLPSGVAIIDAAGAITLVNRRLERTFGYARDELIGRPIDVIIPNVPRIDDSDERRVTALETPPPIGRALVGRDRHGAECAVEVDVHRVDAWHRESFAVIVDFASPDAIERRKSTSRIVTMHAAFERLVGGVLTPARHVERIHPAAAEGAVQFERLVADISVQFINLPVNRIADGVLDALRRIGDMLELDRCTFFHLESDGTAVSPIGWQRPGIPPAPAPVATSQQFPWVHDTIAAGRVLCFSILDEIPDPISRDGYRALGVRSSITVPLSVTGRIVGGVGFNMLSAERVWSPDVVRRLSLFATAFGNVLSRREKEDALRRAVEEQERLREQLHAENVYLRREVKRLGHGDLVIGESLAVRRVLALVEQVAATNSTVLLLGETGTGKELFATRIHELSSRRGRPMVRVNCAAIPATLIESELFGREKGAFTGSMARQIGRFELADQSTIFLDEIGDLPLDVQVKLLRVLEERQVERLGSPKAIRVDTRVIAATHRNLEQRIAEGTFRDDLFYRLNVFPIQVPPLRERIEDIPLLVARFVDEFAKSFGKRIDAISRENIAALQHYTWPGNIRELRNVVERAMIVATGSRLTIPVPHAAAAGSTAGLMRQPTVKLIDVEREHIRTVLERAGWRIRGAGGAADRLGMRPTTLETRMAKLGLARPRAS